jgi:hypothetical protein
MAPIQGIEFESLIPPSWTTETNGSRNTVGVIDVTAAADGNALLLVFFDVVGGNSWNVVFKVDKIA